MKRRSFRDVVRSLGTLDPADSSYREISPENRAALLARILADWPDVPAAPPGLAPFHQEATAATVRGRMRLFPSWRAGVSRRFVLVAASTAVAVAAGLVAVATVGTGSPAYAATPTPLSYRLPTDPPAATELLQRLAAVAERAPAVPGTGDYEYLKLRAWGLDVSYQEYARSYAWKIQPEDRESWWGQDRSGRRDTRVRGEPGGDPALYYAPGAMQRNPLAVNPVPSDPDALGTLLGLPGTIYRALGTTSVLTNISILAGDTILTPAVRAGILRMLAGRGDITYAGRTVDRSGRSGEAFCWEGDVMTGKARDTIVVSPADGTILGYERVQLTLSDQDYAEFLGRLLADLSDAKDADWPPPLKIRTPAVVEYSVFLAAERRALPPPNETQRAEMVWPESATPTPPSEPAGSTPPRSAE